MIKIIMGKTKIKVGQIYGEWSVIGEPFHPPHTSYAKVLCRCSCGIEREVSTSKLWGGKSKTCGHSARYPEVVTKKTSHLFRHGLARRASERTTEYSTWLAMKQRCSNPKNLRFRHYGGRGIKVCDQWTQSFSNFLADMGPKPGKDYSIDRINNDGDYEPSNCRWATIAEQHANQTHHGGKRKIDTFILERSEDVSGVSGVGKIAEGIVFHDGQVVLSWFGQHHTIEICPSIDDVIDIHGHDGRTKVKWD